MIIYDVQNDLKIGMKVRTNGDIFDANQWITGVIGEINDGWFYVWQNEHEGNQGIYSPMLLGFKYSWKISLDNNVGQIYIDGLYPKPSKQFGIVKFMETTKKC